MVSLPMCYNDAMAFPLLLLFFVLGAIVGSFLNVAVFRHGVRALSGRSLCFSCGKTLRSFELVPIVSFFAQGRRCRSCKSRLSWQYPLVELLTGLVFALVFHKHLSFDLSGLSTNYYLLAIDLLLWSLLIALSVYDLRHKIIPNLFVYGFLLLSFLSFLTKSSQLQAISSLDFFGGLLLASPFALLWFLSRGRAIGLGDAKLMLGFPWFVGFAKAVSAVVVGFWLGAAVALVLLLLKAVSASLPRGFSPNLNATLKGLTMKTELPLAPFLVLGLFIVYLTGIDVTGLGQLLAVSF